MTPAAITPADVRAGVARELRHLTDLGLSGLEAQRRAVAIVRAKISNSPVLAERQAHPGRCHACDAPLDGLRPEIAVLNPGGAALHMHQGECHDAYRARRRVLVSKIMSSAGYGAETEGEAA